MSVIPSRLRSLITLGWGCLLVALPLRADNSLDAQIQQAVAAMTMLNADSLLYGTAEDASRLTSKDPSAPSMQEAFKVIQVLAGRPEEALKYIKHADPKVRTLAMLALFETLQPQYLPVIASLVNDTGVSFPQPQYKQFHTDSVLVRPMSVGAIAKQLLEPYLRCAGVNIWQGDPSVSQTLEKYLHEHQGRQFFGLWLVKWNRASWGSTPVDKSRYPKINEFRRELDTLPSPERELIKLRLWTPHHSEAFLSDVDLVAIAKQLGRGPLLDLLAGKLATTDADLNGQLNDFYLVRFLLDHATDLLQSKDVDWLLERAKTDVNSMSMWTIAASRLAPERAVSILKSAMNQDSENKGGDFAMELWKVAGTAETPYIVDYFYKVKGLDGLNQSNASFFLSGISSTGVSAKPLLKAIITDPRLEQVGFESLRDVTSAANDLSNNQIIDNLREIGPRFGKGGEHYKSAAIYKKEAPQEFARMIAGMKDWRSRLIAAVEAW